MKRLKIILSLCWLGILLFALSGRTVHVLFEHAHEDEFVCKETATHLHEKPHSCFICDFELQPGEGVAFYPASVPCSACEKIVYSTYSTPFFAGFDDLHYLRGPPAA